jgi:hypothetical protein
MRIGACGTSGAGNHRSSSRRREVQVGDRAVAAVDGRKELADLIDVNAALL